jgi:hypothetical protein
MHCVIDHDETPSTDAFPLVIVLHGRRSAERTGMGCSEERT